MPNYQPYQYQGYYQPQYPQMQMPQQQMAQMPSQANVNLNSTITWVNSRKEAENYLVGINNAVTMWDSNGKYIYTKKTDASGRPEFHAYSLTEVTNEPSQDSTESSQSDFATKEDILSIKERLNHIEAKLKEEEADG